LKNKVKRVVLISLAILILYFISTYVGLIPSAYNYSVLLATLFAFINFSIFVVSYQLGYKKKAKTFILYTLGSLLVRLFLMAIVIFISIKFLKVDIVGFIFAFFIWYVFLLFFEILIVQNGINVVKTKDPV
jgi:hypothetical protein